jgi:hypothetical protein
MRPDRADGAVARLAPRPYAPERSAPPAPLVPRPRPGGGPAARMPDRVRGVAGAVLGDGEDGGADAAEVEMESARVAAAALAAGGLGEHTVVRRQRIVPTDVGSGDDGYSSGEEYEVVREGDFAGGSRGSGAASLTGPWAVAPRFQRQLGAMEEALLHRIETSAAAEKQMLGVARFALSAKLPDSIRDRRVALLRSSVLPALVRTVQRYAHEPRTATVGCSVFSAISADDGEMQLALGAAGAVEAVVACVKKNLGADDSQPTEAGLCALTSLACTLSNRQNMREHGGIEVVIATMGQHSDSSAIQIEGCTLLANCAFGCDENKQLIADKFGIDLVRLLPRLSWLFTSQNGLPTEGHGFCMGTRDKWIVLTFLLLALLPFRFPSLFAAQIVTATKTFPDDFQLQSRACLALRNLTFGSPAIVEVAGAKGAMDAVLSAAKLHPDNLDVVEQAMVGLFNMIASNPGNIDRMDAVPDRVEILLAMLQRFHESGFIQATVLNVFEVMARERPDTIPSLVDADGVAVILAAMRGGITQRPVMHQGAATLRALFASSAHGSAVMQKLGLAGGLPALLELLYISSTYRPPARY